MIRLHTAGHQELLGSYRETVVSGSADGDGQGSVKEKACDPDPEAGKMGCRTGNCSESAAKRSRD